MYQPSDPNLSFTLPDRVAEFRKSLAPMESLKTLKLTGAIVKMTLFTLFLPLAPNLQKLSINVNGVHEDFIGKIASISPQLQSLKLTSKDVYSVDQLIEDIAYYFPGLRQLDLSLSSGHPSLADDQSLSKLFEVNSGMLTSLRLERTGLNIQGLVSLGKYVSKNLEQLKLHESFHSHDSELVAALEEVLKRCGKSLKILDLRDISSPLEARIGELIAQYCTSLEELSLGAHNFTEASLLSIVQQCATRLRKLSLNGGSGITPNVVQIITERCHLIQDLRIPASPRRSKNQAPLDSNILIPLIQKHGARLTHLNVKYWTITNDILDAISTHCARSLRVLRIERNDTLTRSTLSKTLKSCLSLVSVDLLETTSSWSLPGSIEMEAEHRSILDDNCWYD
ncbi:UV-damaged DNA-binding protein rad7 [Basidiobolus ranarum]|uniref:UV-damaged DNA-binding protein rad7 n=1 Tax=Basidiobolus ranarum TaxID=34480 RepID=A0ABR2WIA0_9FUNG